MLLILISNTTHLFKILLHIVQNYPMQLKYKGYILKKQIISKPYEYWRNRNILTGDARRWSVKVITDQSTMAIHTFREVAVAFNITEEVVKFTQFPTLTYFLMIQNWFWNRKDHFLLHSPYEVIATDVLSAVGLIRIFIIRLSQAEIVLSSHSS